MRDLFTILLAVIILSSSKTSASFREDFSIQESFLEMYYLKTTDDQRMLKIALVRYEDRMPVALPDCEINFYAGEDSLIYLGKAMTDREGQVLFHIKEYPGYVQDPEGNIRYSAYFEGNDTLLPAESELYIRDANLTMTLEIMDSVKTIHVSAYYSVNGDTLPAADEDIYFYVKRMFSDLPVGEEFLDENGEALIEFPVDIPGDAEGNLEIIARFDEHYLFGTVEKRENINWGIPTHHETPESYRALWTQIAPVWMIITLTIMLAGVWSHYLFVIIQLVRIRRMAKKSNTSGKMA
ncbi:MAG: hypothetical protein AMS27_08580 [Bacteroides sp. SM23_62_1]|nr:MAG: hypothetical protein AMS27_08580 [Bacteroides sp. SM23_62_1]